MLDAQRCPVQFGDQGRRKYRAQLDPSVLGVGENLFEESVVRRLERHRVRWRNIAQQIGRFYPKLTRRQAQWESWRYGAGSETGE